MSWQERRCNAEGFGRPEPFFFLCEERTYSPLARRASGGIPPVGRARALSEGDAASADACRQFCCLASQPESSVRWKPFAASTACENLPPAALSQL